MADPAQLEALLASGYDTALLRFGLGSAYLQVGDVAAALPHLRAAVVQDKCYSAAWKQLAKALAASGDTAAAVEAYQSGLEAAQAAGDKQAAKEIRVFLKRLNHSD